MKLFDTNLPALYSKYLFEEKKADLSADHTDKMADVLFTGIANILKQAKSIEKPACFMITKIDGSLILAAIIQYFENEDKDMSGNWSLVYTFNEADIPENALKINLNDVNTHSYFRAVAAEKYGMRFDDPDAVVDCMEVFAIQLKHWLDINAKEGAETTVELEGIFEARSAVEGGEKVFALTPGSEIKVLIKDDSAIEK